MPDSSFFTESPQADSNSSSAESIKNWRDAAFSDFQRELGPRINKKKTQELLGSFLTQAEGSEDSIRTIFESFPSSPREKALKLLDKYKQGPLPQQDISPWDSAAQNNIFKTPDLSNPWFDPNTDKRLVNWLGINPEKNAKLVEDTTVNKEYPSSRVHPFRTGGDVVDVLENEAIDRPGPFYEELSKLGATNTEKQHLQNYIYNENIRGKTGQFKPSATKAIDSITSKASDKKSWISFPEKDYTLFRGENLPQDRSIPEVGEIYSKDRPVSFAAGVNVTDQFMGGLTSPVKDQGNRKVLYAVTEYGDEARPKLLIPGNETEIIAPSKSKFEVTGRARLQADPGFFDPASDIELVKLRQLYGIDPLGASISGARDLVRKNAAGALTGAAFSALNPDVARSIEQNQYGSAASNFAKDVAGGAITEAAIKKIAPAVGARAPLFNAVVKSPAARAVAPIAAGFALFNQGRSGSLTDVITKKAANVIPGLKPNPKTDVGRMAGNELMYMFNQLRQGRIPYQR